MFRLTLVCCLIVISYLVLLPFSHGQEKIGGHTFKEWVEKLQKSKNPEEAKNAVLNLTRFGKAAVPSLTRVLEKGGEVFLKREAALGLGILGWQSKSAVPALQKAAKEDNPSLQIQAISSLGHITGDEEGAVEKLIFFLRSGSAFVKEAVAREIATFESIKCRQAVPALVELLKDDRDFLQKSAAATLAKTGRYGAPAIKELENLTKDKSKEIRQLAIAGFGNIGPKASPAVSTLVKVLKEEKDLEFLVLESLSRIGHKAKSAAPALLEKFKDADKNLKIRLAGTLVRIDPDNPEVRKKLNELVKEEYKGQHSILARALAGGGKSAVAVLVKLLESKEPTVVANAATSLGTIGSEAKEAISSLTEKLKSQPQVQLRFVSAIMKIDPSYDVVSVLKELITGKNQSVRLDAIRLAGELGEKGASLVPALIEKAKAENDLAAIFAIEVLGRIGSPAKAAIPVLKKRLSSPENFVRVLAARSLVKIDPEGGTVAIPLLLRMLVSGDPYAMEKSCAPLAQLKDSLANPSLDYLKKLKDNPRLGVRLEAGIALGKISEDDEAIEGILVECLQKGSMQICKQAINHINQLGPRVKGTMPALQELADFANDRGLRQEAAGALAKLKGS